MILQNINDVDGARLQELVDGATLESETLDFKRQLPGNSDRDKHEFLKDVAAMANTAGGDLVFGMAEANGHASGIVPIPLGDRDSSEQRLRQLLDGGLEPRLPSVAFRWVPCSNGLVLVVRVPASYNGPHRVTFGGGGSRFVLRNGNLVSDMTYTQLRGAFDRTASLAEKARSFLLKRHEEIVRFKTPRPIWAGPFSFVHLVPLTSMEGRIQLNLVPWHERDFTQFFHSQRRNGLTRAMNFEGLLVHPPSGEDPVVAYSQIYRNGVMEMGEFAGRLMDPDAVILPSTLIDSFLRECADGFLRNAMQLGLSGPALLSLSLMHTDGWVFGVDGYRTKALSPSLLNEGHLVLPEIWIEDLSIPASIDELVRPQLDILWQAFDINRCLDYTDGGAWAPRR